MPDGSHGLLAADHHHGRVRHRDPARLRLHADRRRRPARAQPHDEPRAADRRACAPARSRASCSRSDVVANAPRIISDLRAFFPPQQGTFLIGPMAKLGWGTPTLDQPRRSASSSRSPGNIAILGVLKVALPAEDAALIVLQVNFVGALEFDKKRLYFFAGAVRVAHPLHDARRRDGRCSSRGATTPTSCFSVGGFHPRVQPAAAAVPEPAARSRSASSTSRLRPHPRRGLLRRHLEHGAVRRHGRALLRLRAPSASTATSASTRCSSSRRSTSSSTISASVSLKVFGVGAVQRPLARSTLEGPTPWRAQGDGLDLVLFFDIVGRLRHHLGRARRTRRCRRST